MIDVNKANTHATSQNTHSGHLSASSETIQNLSEVRVDGSVVAGEVMGGHKKKSLRDQIARPDAHDAGEIDHIHHDGPRIRETEACACRAEGGRSQGIR